MAATGKRKPRHLSLIDRVSVDQSWHSLLFQGEEQGVGDYLPQQLADIRDIQAKINVPRRTDF